MGVNNNVIMGGKQDLFLDPVMKCSLVVKASDAVEKFSGKGEGTGMCLV